MNKKILCLVLATATFLTLFACNKKAQEAGAETSTKIVTVTNKDGEAVTNEDGEVQTQIVVVDEKGSTVTGADGKVVTKTTAAEKSTAKNSTTASTKKATTAATTATKPTTTKATTTAAFEPEIDAVVYVDLSNKKVTPAKYAAAVTFESGGLLGASVVTLNKACEYELSGNWAGEVTITLDPYKQTKITLNGVNIKNPSGPAIRIRDSRNDENATDIDNSTDETGVALVDITRDKEDPKATITFKAGTTSTLQNNTSSLTKHGAIKSEVDLDLQGRGKGILSGQSCNAVHVDKDLNIKNATLEISSGAWRGIRCFGKLTQESGTVIIHAGKDAIKTDKFSLEGGLLYASSSSNDSIDADDNVIISGGTLVADTTESTKNYGIKVRRVNNERNGAHTNAQGKVIGVRADKNDTFAITGGEVLACGYLNTVPVAETTTQNSLHIINKFRAGNTFALMNGGTTALAISTPNARPSIIVSSASIVSGTDYHIYADGRLTGGTSYGNHNYAALVLGGSYSGGGAYNSALINSTVVERSVSD